MEYFPPPAPAPPPRFFVGHMQKTGGTTLRDPLHASFTQDQIYPNATDGPEWRPGVDMVFPKGDPTDLAIDAARNSGLERVQAGDRGALAGMAVLNSSSQAVMKSGDVYTSTGTFGAARRRVVRELSGTVSAPGVLDEPASQASANAVTRKRFQLDLVSLSPTDLVLESFALSSSYQAEKVRELRVDGNRIWRDNSVYTPTGTTPLNDGSTADRTILAGASPTLRVDFEDNQSGSIAYVLVLNFTNGSSSTLSFTINW